MERGGADEERIERARAHGPHVQAGLDELGVELGGPDGGDGGVWERGREAVREVVYGQEEEGGGVPRPGEQGADGAWAREARFGCSCGVRGEAGEKAGEQGGGDVQHEGEFEEVALAERRLVVFPPEELVALVISLNQT